MSERKLNILFVSHDSYMNGAPKSMVEMLEGLEQYINPFVLIPIPGPIENILKKMGIEYRIIPYTCGFGLLGKTERVRAKADLLNNGKCLHQVCSFIKDKKIDLIHSNSSVVNIGAMAAILCNLPHVWHFRELIEEDLGCEYYNKEIKKKLFEVTDQIITISESVQKAYEEKYNLDSICMYDGINIDKYLTPHLFGVTKYYGRILIAGTISEGKGQLEAVKAIGILASQGVKKIRLLIVGMGNPAYVWGIRKYIERNGLSEYVELLPFMDDLSSLREKCDISITASKMEALGRVTAEAMLFGNIVIGADTGGTKELIGDHEERGYLYHQGDATDLASVILKVMGAREQWIMKKAYAQNFICQNMNPAIYGKNIYHIYLDTIKKHISSKPEVIKLVSNITIFGEENVYEKRKMEIDFSAREQGHNIFSAEKFNHILDLWHKNRRNGKKIAEYLRNRKVNTVAIYGFGEIGRMLYDDLWRDDMWVEYAIDREDINIAECIPIIKPECNLSSVDAIIVTTVRETDKIAEYLSHKCSFSILTLEQVVEDMSRY